MKWECTPRGTRIVKKHFAWFPRRIGDTKIWLQPYWTIWQADNESYWTWMGDYEFEAHAQHNV